MRILLLLLAICILVGCVSDNEQGTVQIAAPTHSPEYIETTVARLTAEPALATTLTPFYASILFDEAIRYITVTPTLNAEATQPCFLVADFWQLFELNEAIEDELAPDGIEPDFVESFVSVVWHVSDCDSYIPVSNRIRIWFDETPASDDLTFAIYEALSGAFVSEGDITDDSSRIAIVVYVNNDAVINTTWYALHEAHAND